MKKDLVIIVGPTAVGKTDVSIELAQRLNAEIVSADSMQIYKHMDIGSAKPTVEEMQGVPHYLIDEIDPAEEFSVSDYQHLALEYIQKIHDKGKLPLIVGGTGLYVNSLIYDMNFGESIEDKEFRKTMEALAKDKGKEYVHSILKEQDPEAAERIHPNNLKRVIRALEIIEVSGNLTQDFSDDPVHREDLNIILIGLTRNRKRLYVRINRRVDLMIEAGLIDEVKNLKNLGLTDKNRSMQGIGYKEVLAYLEGRFSMEQMLSIIKQSSRRYAKRQLTWFKRYKEMKWFDLDKCESRDELIADIVSYIRENTKN